MDEGLLIVNKTAARRRFGSTDFIIPKHPKQQHPMVNDARLVHAPYPTINQVVNIYGFSEWLGFLTKGLVEMADL